MVALGVTGESARLTDDERRLVIKKVIESANGMPVTIGTTAASTKAAISYSLEAQKMGAAAVMVSAPPMAKPNLDALFSHYERVAEAVDIPIVVQDYPQTSGAHMPPAFIARLSVSGEHPCCSIPEAGRPANADQDYSYQEYSR